MEINEQPKSVRDPSATKAAASEHPRLRAFFSTQRFHSEWPKFVMRTAELPGVFKAENVEFPELWSQNAINITYDKYFRYVEQEGSTDEKRTAARETSVKQMINRVVDTLVKWGLQFGHLRDELEARVFAKELTFILVTQRASFNSPVWFNIGTRQGRIGEEQASACFINGIGDDMESILELTKTEGMLYKGGSGSGINYSPLRSSLEKLSGGGTASGPVPFIAAHDANGGAIKSGGTTRRAAKMSILNADHGDIEEFINCKATAERMARALIDAGFDGDFRARFGAYQSVPFQNANHSVRVTDAFMRAVEKDSDWNLMARDGKTVLSTVRARHLWDLICDAAWECGDPGLQFDTIINHMHTCPADGRINASNPCSEYMHLDDSACNLASLNLRKFQKQDGSLDVEQYDQATDVMILAMDILVDGAKYPTEKIGNNARKFRQLGLGYANLGAFLMNAGLPYDSDEGRYVTGMLTAKLCGRAYRQSARIAEYLGAFAGYSRNAGAMLDVIDSHTKNLCELHDSYDGPMPQWYDRLYVEARRDWEDAAKHGTLFGFRNSQVTVLAPTGTIAFMMDCDTTGIEPDTSLVKTKKLVGGGTMKIVNEGVYAALARLGYSDGECSSLVGYMLTHGSFVGSALKEEHLPVFDTSFAEPVAKRALRPEAHVLMLAAAQPFISGAISKTCNLPESATREDVGNLYMLAWRKGLKAIALYRDGCKRSQPLSAAHAKETVATSASTKLIEEQLLYIEQLKQQIADLQEKTQARRRKLPDERQAITHKFKITTKDQEMKVYLNCGMYPDGSLGEIFIKSDKEGSTVSGLLDGIATLTSFALQHGVPLASLVQKFKRTAFEPHGWTGNVEIKYAASVLDYIFRYLELRFLNKQPIEVVSVPASEFQAELDRLRAAVGPSKEMLEHEAAKPQNGHANGNGAQLAGEKVQRPCPKCGGVMRRTGACVTCEDCGENTGCG